MLLVYYCSPLVFILYTARTAPRGCEAGIFNTQHSPPTAPGGCQVGLFKTKMPPKSSTKAKKGRGRGTDAGPANQASSSSGFALPTIASQARSGAPAPSRDVVAPQQDIVMADAPPEDDPSTGVQDVEMQNADETGEPQSPVPVVRLPPTVPAPVVAAPPTVSAPVAATPPTVPAPAQSTMTVQALLDALPSGLSKGEQTKAKMAFIRARAAEQAAAKRRRPDSTDDSGESSAAKKQQTEKPSEQQIETPAEHQGAKEPAKKLVTVKKLFPYSEVDKIQPRFCCLRVGDGPILSNFKKQKAWGAKFSIDAGTKGVHAFSIDLMCNIVDKSIPLHDAASDVDTISMIWYTGARTVPDSVEAPYQLEDFEIFFAQDHPGHNAANDSSILDVCSEKMKKHLTYCRFKSNKTFFAHELGSGKEWATLDKAVLRELRKLMTANGAYVEVWFLNPFGQASSFETRVLSHFRRAYEERLPVLSQYEVLHLEGTQTIRALTSQKADSQTEVEGLNRTILEDREANSQATKTLKDQIAQLRNQVKQLESRTGRDQEITGLKTQVTTSQTEVRRLNCIISDYTKTHSETAKALEEQFTQFKTKIMGLESEKAEATERATTADRTLRTYEDHALQEITSVNAALATALDDARQARHDLESLQQSMALDNSNRERASNQPRKKRKAEEMLDEDRATAPPGNYEYNVQDIRDPDFTDPNVPAEVLDKLVGQFDRWDQKAGQGWARHTTKNRCVETRLSQVAAQRQHGNGHAC